MNDLNYTDNCAVTCSLLLSNNRINCTLIKCDKKKCCKKYKRGKNHCKSCPKKD